MRRGQFTSSRYPRRQPTRHYDPIPKRSYGPEGGEAAVGDTASGKDRHCMQVVLGASCVRGAHVFISAARPHAKSAGQTISWPRLCRLTRAICCARYYNWRRVTSQLRRTAGTELVPAASLQEPQVAFISPVSAIRMQDNRSLHRLWDLGELSRGADNKRV
jgi:hypothetical protein